MATGYVETWALGSGIVIDSDAAEEYRECLLKAEFLTGAASAISKLGFTPINSADRNDALGRAIIRLLELHLDRLADSADYFGFPVIAQQ